MAKQTRQSGPEAKPAPKDPAHIIKPGGPIMPTAQTYRNPGATPNLRGVEHNTSFHKGEPDEVVPGTGWVSDQTQQPGRPDQADVHGHGIPQPILHVKGR